MDKSTWIFHRGDLNPKITYAIVVVSVMLLFFYLYLASFPKHGDFWVMSYTSKVFAYGHTDFYNYILNFEKKSLGYIAYPPVFYVIQGLWIKFLDFLSVIKLAEWKSEVYVNFLPWGLILHLFALSISVFISIKYLKKQFLALLWFAPTTFVSLIVMGQIDIFTALFLFISILFLNLNTKTFKNFFGAFIFLGISMWFKTYTAMLIPIYIIKLVSYFGKFKGFTLSLFMLLSLIITFLIPWIPYWSWFTFSFLNSSVIKSESAWILKMQLISPVKQTFTISIWLFGYLLILYDAIKLAITKRFDEHTFSFYSFAIVSWFFASSYTHPQWHIFMVPVTIFLCEKFLTRENLIFSFLYQIIFLIFSMRYSTWEILKYYMPATLITGDYSTIVCTCLSFLLVIWILENRKVLNSSTESNHGVQR